MQTIWGLESKNVVPPQGKALSAAWHLFLLSLSFPQPHGLRNTEGLL